MRKPEQRLWDCLRNTMGGAWHATRIENKVSCGVPDVHFAALYRVQNSLEGWIELKVVPKWPKKPSTPICIPHLTDDQVNWHLTHYNHGGRSWLMVKVGEIICLFPGRLVAEIQEGRTSIWWNERAQFLGHGPLVTPEIILKLLAHTE